MFKTFETTKQSQFKETKTAKRAIFIRIFLCFPRFSLFFHGISMVNLGVQIAHRKVATG